jgi:hypothetical protein
MKDPADTEKARKRRAAYRLRKRKVERITSGWGIDPIAVCIMANHFTRCGPRCGVCCKPKTRHSRHKKTQLGNQGGLMSNDNQPNWTPEKIKEINADMAEGCLRMIREALEALDPSKDAKESSKHTPPMFFPEWIATIVWHYRDRAEKAESMVFGLKAAIKALKAEREDA